MINEICNRSVRPESKTSTRFVANAKAFSILLILFTVGFSGITNAQVPFDFEALTSMIQEHHLSSIEEVLARLPEDLRANYTLMHDSRSLQESSFENPRAILYGKDASLICSFNGEESQFGYDVLECMQFRRATRSFDFRQIQFPTVGNGLPQVTISESGRSVDGRVSCSACHGQDSRPNWLVYSNWKGSYGADDDGLGKDLKPYLAFASRRDQHPRYRFLIQGSSATAPYIARGNNIEERPNLRLSDLLNRMNSLRDARILSSQSSRLMQVEFALAALNCELEPEDEASVQRRGLNVETVLDTDAILSRLKLNPLEWTMRLGSDPRGDTVFDHQAGFSFLNIDVAMALVTELAETNSELQKALARIEVYYTQNYGVRPLLSSRARESVRFPAKSLARSRAASVVNYQADYLATLNHYVLDPDYFGSFEENTAPICRELSHQLVQTL